jgi:hypothetical protein
MFAFTVHNDSFINDKTYQHPPDVRTRVLLTGTILKQLKSFNESQLYRHEVFTFLQNMSKFVWDTVTAYYTVSSCQGIRPPCLTNSFFGDILMNSKIH